MKKYLAITLLILFLVPLYASLHAQGTSADRSSFAFLSKDKVASILSFLDEGNSDKEILKEKKASYKALKANARALKDFNKYFKDVTGAKWTANSNCITAYSEKGNVQTRVIYDKNGRWVHTLLSYDESSLPKNVRAAVNSAFPGFSISSAQEINEGVTTFYVVNAETKTHFKKVIVHDDEVIIYQEFKFSK